MKIYIYIFFLNIFFIKIAYVTEKNNQLKELLKAYKRLNLSINCNKIKDKFNFLLNSSENSENVFFATLILLSFKQKEACNKMQNLYYSIKFLYQTEKLYYSYKSDFLFKIIRVVRNKLNFPVEYFYGLSTLDLISMYQNKNIKTELSSFFCYDIFCHLPAISKSQLLRRLLYFNKIKYRKLKIKFTFATQKDFIENGVFHIEEFLKIIMKMRKQQGLTPNLQGKNHFDWKMKKFFYQNDFCNFNLKKD